MSDFNGAMIQPEIRRLLERGRIALRSGRLKEAVQAAQQLSAQLPDNASVSGFAAQVAHARGDIENAAGLIGKAIDASPNRASFYIIKAQILVARREAQDAVEALNEAVQLAADDVEILLACGQQFSMLEMQEQAHKLFEKALKLAPNHPLVLHNISATHRFLGHLREAEQAASRAIQLDNNNLEAYFLRADLRKVTPQDNHLAAMEARRAEGLPRGMQGSYLLYALAKEYEDVGEYEKSFDCLRAGARARREVISYSVEKDEAIMKEIAECYSADFLQREVPGHDDRSPVFVIGMPRTGTTLLERIMTGHSQVSSAGERTEFSVALSQEANRAVGRDYVARNGLVKASTEMDFKELGQNYTRMMGFYRGGHPRGDTSRGGDSLVVDKLPFNFLYTGLIKRALPGAKIIHVIRDPMDTCYAVYKMLFNRAYPFSYDLEELARYYIAYRGLMAHWLQVMGNQIHTVAYEDLVQGTEAEARRLFDFLGLDFESSSLDFDQNRIATTTASASQVRRGVYTSSLQNWRHYEHQLERLYHRLEEASVLTWPQQM